MKTLAVIPARLAATRLPGKPLRLLAGSPLVVRVWERVAHLELADRCVVATDHEDVAAAVRQAGAECVLTRDDHPSGTDRVAEVAAMPEYRGYDVIINVQGDEPFMAPEAVTQASAMVADGRFPLGTAAVRADRAILTSPNVVKVVTADDARALYFSRAPIPFLRDESDRALLDSRILQHIGIYAYTRDALARWVALPPHPFEQIERLEQLRPLAAGMAMGVAVVANAPGQGVDTEEDLIQANRRWTEFVAGQHS